MIQNNQPLLQVSYSETSATAMCDTTGTIEIDPPLGNALDTLTDVTGVAPWMAMDRNLLDFLLDS